MTLLSNVKFFKWKIFSNFVSFSECPYYNECACYWFVLRTFVFTVQCGVLNVRLYEGQSFVILDICKHRDTFCDSYKIPSYLFSKAQNWCIRSVFSWSLRFANEVRIVHQNKAMYFSLAMQWWARSQGLSFWKQT